MIYTRIFLLENVKSSLTLNCSLSIYWLKLILKNMVIHESLKILLKRFLENSFLYRTWLGLGTKEKPCRLPFSSKKLCKYCYYIFDNKSRFWYREQTVLVHLHLCTSIKKFHFFISASNKMSLFLNLNMQKGYSELKIPFKPWTVCLYVQHFVISPLPSQPNPPLYRARVKLG